MILIFVKDFEKFGVIMFGFFKSNLFCNYLKKESKEVIFFGKR